MLKKWFLTMLTGLMLSAAIAFAADKININTATAEQLQVLNGVGAATAQAIISYRDQNGAFNTIEDLLNVKGIGDKKVEKLADQITVSDPE